MIAGGILLSPVFAFMLAVVAEISIDVLTQGGVSTLLILAAAVISGRLLFLRHRARLGAGNLIGDQA
jgi:Gpi18-like mannosyltransferase